MREYQPEIIYIHEDVKNLPLTKEICRHYQNSQKLVVNQVKDIEKSLSLSLDPVTEGKKHLYLTKNRGSFVKKCPGTNGLICCNYYVIDLVENCPLECSYCFLQNYLTGKMITVYVNVDDLFDELDRLLADKNSFYRVGTGELSDSLALDGATSFSTRLIDYFKNRENALLELKTKTNHVDKLPGQEDLRNVVISWSLNPQSVIDREEPVSASLSERLEAAFRAEELGYQLAFHFDPIILFDGWEEAYASVLTRLFRKIKSRNVAWISLGGFRYTPPQHKIIETRFPGSRVIYDELFMGPDGKMRYFIKKREKIYQFMLDAIKKQDEKLFVYLCMEGKYMWERVYGYSPKSDMNLDRQFLKRQDDMGFLGLKCS